MNRLSRIFRVLPALTSDKTTGGDQRLRMRPPILFSKVHRLETRGVAEMAQKLLSIVGAGMLAVALSGCTAAGPSVVRGQCPPGGSCQPGYGACQPGGCPTGTCQSGNCGPGGSCMNLPFHPVHRNYMNYQVPTNLSYPEPNTPAAVVQYPYYTLKGPSDFFMK